jgi:hypothetical protein
MTLSETTVGNPFLTSILHKRRCNGVADTPASAMAIALRLIGTRAAPREVGVLKPLAAALFDPTGSPVPPERSPYRARRGGL